MNKPILPLENMSERHHGLTPCLAETYVQAARVCLDKYHLSPQDFVLDDDSKDFEIQVAWEKTTERERVAWANQDDATRDGAYACALASIELNKNMVALRRMETLSGADYYIGPIGIESDDLEQCFRLEVSGTQGDAVTVKTRLRAKAEQTRRGNSSLPAIAAVVGYQARLIMVQTVEDEK